MAMKKTKGSFIIAMSATFLICMLINACAPKETLDPMYEPKDYSFKEITLDIPTVISNIDPIEPTGIRRFIYKIPLSS